MWLNNPMQITKATGLSVKRQTGQTLDPDVYDAAEWSCMGEII